MALIPFQDWSFREKQHRENLSPIVDNFLKRRGLQITHPVHDFLFTYYNFSPTKLKKWVPSFEETLLVEKDFALQYPWLVDEKFSLKGNQLTLNLSSINESILKAVQFIKELSTQVLKETPRFHCFGLHEWAMVYKASPESIRHQSYSLRLNQKELSTFLESQTICCSHFDAYRFFTQEAAPLNILKPLSSNRIKMEQGGCLHTNMDLYKWATRLYPFIGSDFIAKTLFLALEARELDMRASPYDLTKMGYQPICIETESGREEYQKEQRKLSCKAKTLRETLAAFCERFIKKLKSNVQFDVGTGQCKVTAMSFK